MYHEERFGQQKEFSTQITEALGIKMELSNTYKGIHVSDLWLLPLIKDMIVNNKDRLYVKEGLDFNCLSNSGKAKINLDEHKISVPRFQQERCFACQYKYRRLVVQWERISACFDAFVAFWLSPTSKTERASVAAISPLYITYSNGRWYIYKLREWPKS